MGRPKYLIVAGAIMLLLSNPALVRSFAWNNNSWDVLIFVQHWPKSVCDKWMQQRSGNTCSSYPKGPWTIHGIWPTRLGSRGPNDCDSSRPFNLQEISSMERELDQWWTPIQNHNRKTYFWEHEWNKHGTCASSVLPTQEQYFRQALDWAKNYGMANVLQRAGITPGRSYTRSAIEEGVRSILKKTPQVICYRGQGGSVLLEIRICFDQSLLLVDCNKYSDCGSDVQYPSP